MRKVTMILALFAAFMFTSAVQAGCPHAKKHECPHAKKHDKGHKCSMHAKGVKWTLADIKGGVVAEATVAGCPKRSVAVRAEIAAEIPKCSSHKCDCKKKKPCPFAIEGVDFKVDNGDKVLKVTATSADVKKLEEFKTRIKALADAPKGEDHGCDCNKK